jgi:hypothetical protein
MTNQLKRKVETVETVIEAEADAKKEKQTETETKADIHLESPKEINGRK